MSAKRSVVSAVVIAGAALLAIAILLPRGYYVLGGITLAGSAAAMAFRYSRRKAKKEQPEAAPKPTRRPSKPASAAPEDIKAELEPRDDTEALVLKMLKDGRYALLLRRQIVGNLAPELYESAMETLDEKMALVPKGQVVLHAWRSGAGDEMVDDRMELDRTVDVQPVYLDRYPVTNREYQTFIDGGGYEQMSLWDPAIWPAVLDFVDQTGHPGPRYWENGAYTEDTADQPVVGVCWYEASAFARWSGKRLPTDPEWVKAGAWPVPTETGKPIQRKFPWGNSMERNAANIFGTGPDRIVDVTEFDDGVSVGGIYQLIGNVWEWTANNFGKWDAAVHRLETPTPMKIIRGGAFDTYFENQAACQFQSGDSPVARKRNIGFRCALGVCDVAAPGDDQEQVDKQDEQGEPELTACGAED